MTMTTTWLVWCTEYPDDGSIPYDAATAYGAEQKYRADTDADAETSITVERVDAACVASLQGEIETLRHELHVLRGTAATPVGTKGGAA